MRDMGMWKMGLVIKFFKKEVDHRILIPSNRGFKPETLDRKELTFDPVIGRPIQNWQTV